MFSSIKRLTKHSAIYGIGHIISRLVNFLLLPLHTNLLTPADFGVLSVVFSVLAVMTIIYTFGLDSAFLRYFILNDDPKKRKEVFSTAFWAVCIFAGGFTALMYVNASAISRLVISEGDFTFLFQLTSLILLFDALAFLPLLFLRAEEKSRHYVVLKFINVLVNVAMNIVFLVYLRKGVEGVFWANLWASIFTFGLVLPILFRNIGFHFLRTDFNELFKFGLPYVPAALSVVVLDIGNRFILERMVGLEITGIFSAGYKLGIFMSLIVAAFRFAWPPFFLSTSKQENAKDIFAKVLTYYVFVTLGIFLAISFLVDDLVRLKIIGEQYWKGAQVVPTVLLAYLVYGIYVNFMVGIYIEKKTKYLPIITGLGAAVNVAANILLIPLFSMMGSAYSTLLGYVVMAGLLYLVSQKFYAIPYEFGRILKMALVAAAIFYAGYYVHGAWGILLKVILIAAFPLILYVIGFFERRELDALKRMFAGGFAQLRGESAG
jgi:O-antigen/teichoic acid export membrane protein